MAEELAYKQIYDIIGSTARPATLNVAGSFYIGDMEVPIYKINSIVNIKKFETNVSDDMEVTLMLTVDMYNNYIYPGRDLLYLHLNKTLVDESAEIEISGSSDYMVYRAILKDPFNQSMTTAKEIDESQGLITLTVQCLHPTYHNLMMTRVGGIFKGTDPLEVIGALLTKYSSEIEVDDRVRVRGVDIVPYDVDVEKRRKRHIVIPHGHRSLLVNIHNYLQSEYGVYNHDVGLYLHRNIWYVYPKYRTSRYEETNNTADIIILPNSYGIGLDRTYTMYDGHLYIGVRASAGHIANRDVDYNELGNGIRFILGEELHNSFSVTTNNISTVDPSVFLREYVIDPSRTRLDNAPYSDSRITNNIANEHSKLANRNGEVVSCTWDSSDPTLIYPGMPIRLHYTDKTGETQADGVVLGTVTNTALSEDNIESIRYRSVTELILFIDRSN